MEAAVCEPASGKAATLPADGAGRRRTREAAAKISAADCGCAKASAANSGCAKSAAAKATTAAAEATSKSAAVAMDVARFRPIDLSHYWQERPQKITFAQIALVRSAWGFDILRRLSLQPSHRDYRYYRS